MVWVGLGWQDQMFSLSQCNFQLDNTTLSKSMMMIKMKHQRLSAISSPFLPIEDVLFSIDVVYCCMCCSHCCTAITPLGTNKCIKAKDQSREDHCIFLSEKIGS